MHLWKDGYNEKAQEVLKLPLFISQNMPYTCRQSTTSVQTFITKKTSKIITNKSLLLSWSIGKLNGVQFLVQIPQTEYVIFAISVKIWIMYS